MTLFGIYLRLCGLEDKEAALSILSMKYSTVIDARKGKFRIADGVLAELVALRRRIEDEADALLDRLEAGAPPYTVDVAGDDEAAVAMGWPLAHPQNVMAQIVVAALPVDQVRIATYRGLDLVFTVEECRALTVPRLRRSQRMKERRRDPAFMAALQGGIEAARHLHAEKMRAPTDSE